ncbi:MAG: hypothetical protein ACHQE6_03495 [Solirubrobacterales bacterium]
MRRSATFLSLAPLGALLVALLAGAVPAPAPASRAAAPRPPLASTGTAAHIGDSTAVLNGTVNPHGLETTCYFQYGPTAAYGAQTPTVAVGSGAAGVKESQILSGLPLGTLYHYRLVAMSSAGTFEGRDRTFTTKQIPLKFVFTNLPKTTVFGSPFSVAGTLTGTGGADHQVILQASAFPYLTSYTDVGEPQSTDAGGGFSFHLASLAQATRLRVRTLDALPVYSPVATMHVAVLVTLRAHPAGARGIVRLDGTVKPAQVGATVVFQWLKPGHGPVKVGSAITRSATAGFSRFRAVVSIRHGGQYRALVKVANGRQISGSSNAVILHGVPAHVRKGKRKRKR